MKWNDERRCWEDTMRINGVEIPLIYITSYKADPSGLIDQFTNLDISKVTRDSEDFAINSIYLDTGIDIRGKIELGAIIITSEYVQFMYRYGIKKRIMVEHDYEHFYDCYVM